MPDLWAGWSCCPACTEAGRSNPADSVKYHAGLARNFSLQRDREVDLAMTGNNLSWWPEDAPLIDLSDLTVLLGGSDTSFTGILCHLLVKADLGHFSRLAQGFPVEAEVIRTWRAGAQLTAAQWRQLIEFERLRADDAAVRRLRELVGLIGRTAHQAVNGGG